jgi:penicillin-binding protein 1A
VAPRERNPTSSVKRLLLLAFLFFGSVSFLFFASGAGIVWYFSRDLPSLDSLRQYQPSLVTKVYSEDGSEVGQFYIERRVLVPLSQMPQELFQAIIAVEDSRFFEHKGIDPFGIFRAILANLEAFRIRQGASTITQQLVRSLFLSAEKSFKRKIKEAILARKIERILSKDEILEIYLNQIYFGHGAYGVQAGARTYFGKDVKSLSLAESAFLAGLPKAPRDYSPYNDPEKAKHRQGVVLRRMVDEDFITAEKYQEAYQEDMYFQKLGHSEETGPYFLEYVRQYIASIYGETALYRGGLNVYTTMNLQMQKVATQAVKEGLRAIDKRQGFRGPIDHFMNNEANENGSLMKGMVNTIEIKPGAILRGVVTEISPDGVGVLVNDVKGKILKGDMNWAKRKVTGKDLRKDFQVSSELDPGKIFQIGDVLWVKTKTYHPLSKEGTFSLEQEPLVQGSLLSLDPTTGAIKAMVGGYDFEKSEFNRSIYAKRQPGSAFKPIIFAAALNLGFTPASIVYDSPVIFENFQMEKVWKPENYEKRFYGPISLREALTHSRNVATVKLLEKIGIKNVTQFSRQLGIVSPLTNDLSLALGSSSLSLVELTSVFGVLANEGLRNEPYVIDLVTDPSGKVLERHYPESQGVVPKHTAYLITNMLVDVVQRGTGRRAKVLGRPLGGKTGTTNDFTDAWFVGFVKNLATGVWVGFDDMRSLGDRESGAKAALPIWISYMREALEIIPSIPFEIPEDIVYAKIDPKTGLLVSPESKEGVIEVFVKGTEPQEHFSSSPKPVEFFELDQSL